MSTEPGRWTPGEAGVAQHGLSLASTATTRLQRSPSRWTPVTLVRHTWADLPPASTEPGFPHPGEVEGAFRCVADPLNCFNGAGVVTPRRLLERQVVALGLLGASTEPRVVTPRRPPSQARAAASGGELQRSRGVTTLRPTSLRREDERPRLRSSRAAHVTTELRSRSTPTSGSIIRASSTAARFIRSPSAGSRETRHPQDRGHHSRRLGPAGRARPGLRRRRRFNLTDIRRRRRSMSVTSPTVERG